MKAPQPYCLNCYENKQDKKSFVRKILEAIFVPEHMTNPSFSREFPMVCIDRPRSIFECQECGNLQTYRRAQ